LIDLGLDLIFWCTLYVVLLLVIGSMGGQARQGESLRDYFLAGRTMGPIVLLLTFFATQYSGNSLSGFPGQTYRQGLSYFMSVTFMIGIVAGYTLFAPRLYAASRRKNFLTPTDFLSDRFRSPLLNDLSAAIFAWALLNFLLAQFIALGNAFASFTQGEIPYWAAVVVGAVVVLIYVIVGGMRAVAWTDALQGILLVVGLVFIVMLIWMEVGSPTSVARTVQLLNPEMVSNPTLTECLVWLSHFILLALGAPLYPQALQRIYAAQRLRHLRNSLATMAVIPLFAVSIVIFIGAAGLALFPQLDRLETEQVTFRVVSYLVESNTLAYYPALMVMMAVVAAIMSTADSCLLSLSSIFTKDFVARIKHLKDDQVEQMRRWVPLISIAVMTVVVILAIGPRMTLWGLLIIKFEILIQLSPAFIFGTLHKREDPRAFVVQDIVPGLVSGLMVTLGLYLGGYLLAVDSLFGFHFGTVGVLANYSVVVGHRWWRLRGGK
jgi:SSS family solute:Na+ symporter/sodium/pantothenate symporter